VHPIISRFQEKQHYLPNIQTFALTATFSRGETLNWRAWRRIGWLPGIIVADVAWTQFP